MNQKNLISISATLIRLSGMFGCWAAFVGHTFPHIKHRA